MDSVGPEGRPVLCSVVCAPVAAVLKLCGMASLGQTAFTGIPYQIFTL